MRKQPCAPSLTLTRDHSSCEMYAFIWCASMLPAGSNVHVAKLHMAKGGESIIDNQSAQSMTQCFIPNKAFS
jgi:hypothetical protein